MALFVIVLIALWSYPILANASIFFTKSHPKLRKILIGIPLVLSALTLICVLTGISTVSSTFNWIMASICYLSVSQLLFLAHTIKYLIVKIVVILMMFIVFGIGYLSGSIGILGVGFIINDLQVDRVIPLGEGVIYRQYDSGNAISDGRNIEIVISKKIKCVPLLQYDIFSKVYWAQITYGKNVKLPIHKKAPPTLYSYNFPIKYIADKKQLILLDSIQRDTITLK